MRLSVGAWNFGSMNACRVLMLITMCCTRPFLVLLLHPGLVQTFPSSRALCSIVRICGSTPTQLLVFLASFIGPLGPMCRSFLSVYTYHTLPLLQWLRSIETSREQFGIVKGNCPYCSHVSNRFAVPWYMCRGVCMLCLRGRGNVVGIFAGETVGFGGAVEAFTN